MNGVVLDWLAETLNDGQVDTLRHDLGRDLQGEPR
jgi:hypothetical protein